MGEAKSISTCSRLAARRVCAFPDAADRQQEPQASARICLAKRIGVREEEAPVTHRRVTATHARVRRWHLNPSSIRCMLLSLGLQGTGSHFLPLCCLLGTLRLPQIQKIQGTLQDLQHSPLLCSYPGRGHLYYAARQGNLLGNLSANS